MGIVSKFKNLNKVASRLKKRKFTRVKEIVRDYGVGELLRRVREKMDTGGAYRERLYVLTNESYLKNLSRLSKYTPVDMVEFSFAPGARNVGKVEIATAVSGPAPELTLEVFGEDGEPVVSVTTGDVVNMGYTTFEFLPVLDTSYSGGRIKVGVRSNGGCGVLVSRRKRRSFEVAGGGGVVCKVYTRMDALYLHWLKNNTPSEADYAAQRARRFDFNPKFSVAVPLYNTPEDLLRDMIQSVIGQTYANWELCLADGSNADVNLKPIVDSFNDERIKYLRLEKNEGIAGNSNRAIDMATGGYIALLDHDDTLMPHALYSNALLINEDPSCDFIYSDEDKLSADGSRRFDPFFKPDFSPDMLNSFNYITHFTVIKKRLIDEVGAFDAEYNGAQDYDLFLRATEKAEKIGHIADVLYNWRIVETSTAYSSDSKSYTVSAGKAALEASIKRRNVDARVELGVLPNYYNIVYSIPNPQPLVSIIIPNRNEQATLKKCVGSILKKSTYGNYEIVIAENNSTDIGIFEYYASLERDSRIRIVKWDKPFNYSSINNYAAKEARGDLLVFLNNDTSVISPDWLEQMAMHALRKEVGAVGAKLLYPDDTVQHGGVVLRIGGIAGHSHKFVDAGEVGAFARMAIVHDVAAVTAACLMTRAEVFHEAGGFDEIFTHAYNDVDLCLKVLQMCYNNIWTPFAKLYHYESKTRGYEDTPEKIERFNRERALWLDKWGKRYPSDPYYNKNLTLINEDYSISPGKIT